VSSVGSSTRGLESSLEAALESVGWSVIQLISASIESHNGDDATKERFVVMCKTCACVGYIKEKSSHYARNK
jgi:hypothetical protein